MPDAPPRPIADASAGLPRPVELLPAERDLLLSLARTALAVAVGAGDRRLFAAAAGEAAAVTRHGAAFVTLTEDGELRGCIGHMDATAPLVESVAQAAQWAARSDPRFAAIRRAELPRIHVEVSVLGPLVPLDDPGAFRLGIDGIVVERDGRRGLLLPEVAPMLGNDRVAMLEVAGRKAGLPPGAWRDSRTRLSVFRTDRFGGPAIEG